MVTTQLDFMHLRTTAGLARQVRRVARRLRRKKYEHHIEKLSLKLKAAIEKGSIDDVDKDFGEEIKLANKEEDELFTILKDELELLNEVSKVEIQEREYNERLKSVIGKLRQDDQKNFETKIAAPLSEVIKKSRECGDKSRRYLDALKGDEVAFLEMQRMSINILGESWQERAIKIEARKEKKDIRKEKHEVAVLFDEFDKLANAIKDNKIPEAHSRLQKIVKVDKDLVKRMIDELHWISDIILRAAIIYVKFKKFLEELPKQLRTLQANKFPEEHRKKLEVENAELFSHVTKHREDLYAMARYMDYRERAV